MRRVVVTGMGAVTPVGNDIKTMWGNLIAGRHGIDAITKFDCTGYKASLAAEVKGFDPLDYMERQEARRLDLYSQYAIAAAAQAVRDSGAGTLLFTCTPDRNAEEQTVRGCSVIGAVPPERLAVYFGSGIGGIMTFENEHEKMLSGGPRKVSPLFIPMMIGNLGAGNIAIRFGAKGACVSVVTACCTGADAIGQAYRAIKHGYADAAIAGGSEAAVTPMGIAGFTNMTALSLSSDKDAASLPFDKRRSGFVMGEGAGALVLEEYDLAVRRGARIYAEVVGYSATCDAHHITAPSPNGESSARAISEAYREACGAGKGDGGGMNSGIDKGNEGPVYINAHGTGTPLNDAAETRAIKAVMGGDTKNILVSSTKSMTGHMLGAAGAVEAIISILALTEGVLPPTAGLYEPDPECDLDYIPLTARKASPELAMTVSLGFGGHNACLAFAKGKNNG